VWSGFHNNSSDLTHLNSGFLADFEQRIIDRATSEWQSDCGAVSMPKDSIQTRVVSFDTGAKHFIIPTETRFV